MATAPDGPDSDWLVRVIRNYDAGQPSREDLKRVLAQFKEIADQQQFPQSKFPVPMLRWLSKGIELYLSEEVETLGKGLGLEERGRSPSIDTADANLDIACEVDAELAKGVTQEDAFETVRRRRYRKGVREIQRAYNQYWHLAWLVNESNGLERDPEHAKKLAKKFAKMWKAILAGMEPAAPSQGT